MGLKLRIGAAFDRALHATLASRLFPLTRYFPHGISWLYDLQRFMGTRRLGTVFDVGANTGQTATSVLRYAPQAEIHSFEPADEPFATLQARFGRRRNVHLYKLALGSRAGTLDLRLRANSELNTLVPGDDGGRTQPVPVATVDEIVAVRGLSHLDVMKIDVQGWEREVLRGAAGLIARHDLVFVLAEMAFRADRREMQQFGELHDHLEAQGFVLCGLYEPVRYGPRKEFVLFANGLYLHPGARLKWTEMAAEWTEWLTTQDPREGH
ncbi:MAG TPA: FkbM family methyltransferase [Reyranella sp.]|nr:FkbM family methyltransferase [Reyranella sp.]